MPIRVRLAIVIMLATGLTAALGRWISVRTLGDRLHTSLVAELTARADAVSHQLQQTPQITSSPSGGLPDLSDSQSVTQILDWNGAVVASAGMDPGTGLSTSLPLLRPLEGRRRVGGTCPGLQFPRCTWPSHAVTGSPTSWSWAHPWPLLVVPSARYGP